MVASTVVDEDDMQFLAFSRLFEVTRVGGYRLPRGAAGEQAQEDAEMAALGNELLDSHTGDVDIRKMGAHVGITFVGTDNEFACFGNGEIDPGERDAPGHKFLP